MRILLLITDLEFGGTPTVVRELAVRLHKTGAEIEVACLSTWGPVADQLQDFGVPVTALQAAGSYDLSVIGRLTRLIRERKYETVFSFLMHANAIAAAASLRLPGVRWIQSIQTTQPWPRWHWMIQKIAQHAAEVVVVPSPSVANIAHRWADVPIEKIIVIHNAIDLADWTGHQSTVPGDDPRPYPIAFIGRLDPIKDIPTLVTAVAWLAPLVHLHIYGEGSDRGRIENQIRQTGAPVTLHGSIASPQSAMSTAGMLILPSLAEGFGLVLIEAMAAGVPVVATNVPGICDVVRTNETGLLIPPSDPVSLAAAIRRIVEDTAVRRRLIDAASADVHARFTWDAILPQYRKILNL